MNKNIFLACDTTNLSKVRKIIRYTQSKKLKIGYKFGLEFFYSKSGRSFLSKMDKKQTIFLVIFVFLYKVNLWILICYYGGMRKRVYV